MGSRATVPGPVDEEDDDRAEAMPFADLAPVSIWSADGELHEFHDWQVRRKPPESFMQQARPQPMVIPPVPEKPPPRSMGYPAFADKFLELEKAGIIDGSGQWPSEEAADR